MKKIMLKVALQIGQKKLTKKVICHGHILIVILMVKKLLDRFTKNDCKSQVKKNLGSKK